MVSKTIQIEVVLNFLNTLFSKAIFYKDKEMIGELNHLRHNIYYGEDFVYEDLLTKLQNIELKLESHE